jgi:hypothetical protein
VLTISPRPAPQAIPAPIAIMAMMSPLRRRPARFASSSVVGSDAEEVFP